MRRFMVDAYIMADATGLVGSFESTAPRVVHALATGVYGCLKPFITVSDNWYWSPWFMGADVFSQPLIDLPRYKKANCPDGPNGCLPFFDMHGSDNIIRTSEKAKRRLHRLLNPKSHGMLVEE